MSKAGKASGEGRRKDAKGVNAKVEALKPFMAGAADQVLTTNQGVRVNDDQNSLKSGERGGSLLEDFNSPREDHPFRSRAHSRADRARSRLGRPWCVPRETEDRVPA
jgi:hypothetical protein